MKTKTGKRCLSPQIGAFIPILILQDTCGLKIDLRPTQMSEAFGCAFRELRY